jgi:hypothetical protein
MSSRKKIRQAPGRLLRQKLVISVRCVARVETLPLKGPRLLIRHWILYTEKSHTQTCLLRLPGGCLHPTRQQSQRPEGLSTKYNFVYKNQHPHYRLRNPIVLNQDIESSILCNGNVLLDIESVQHFL